MRFYTAALGLLQEKKEGAIRKSAVGATIEADPDFVSFSTDNSNEESFQQQQKQNFQIPAVTHHKNAHIFLIAFVLQTLTQTTTTKTKTTDIRENQELSTLSVKRVLKPTTLQRKNVVKPMQQIDHLPRMEDRMVSQSHRQDTQNN